MRRPCGVEEPHVNLWLEFVRKFIEDAEFAGLVHPVKRAVQPDLRIDRSLVQAFVPPDDGIRPTALGVRRNALALHVV